MQNAPANQDFDAVRAGVEASQVEFMKALGSYQSYNGKQIVERFLQPFKMRSEVTRAIEKEAEDSIETFDAVCASLADRVKNVVARMNGTVAGIAAHTSRVGINKMAEPAQIPPGASATEIMIAEKKQIREACEEIQKTSAWAKQTGLDSGLRIVQIQTMAADLIRLRTLTLRVFKEENIGNSFHDLIHDLEQRQYAKTGIALLDESAERIWEAAKELGTFIAEKNPSVELFNLLKRLGKALRGKKTDTTPGGTERLNELVSQLRHEAEALGELDKAYESAMNEFERIDAIILR